jgi:uncharacterized membrane protein YeiB
VEIPYGTFLQTLKFRIEEIRPMSILLFSIVPRTSVSSCSAHLAQSLVLSFVFYGWGLGQFGHMSAATGILLAIGIYAEAIASALWLRRFRFGPLEWMWRSFSYGRRV